ncbi:uncharacterized protein G2W53_034339 [Senna tora]|uniref:Uncharacterized protein n=1 Tax=Senna tora TaxID=362788 RepID=A0A834W9F3_9FABA|nr:uncharacterized protein G2W53_034339 [Senna tora]
MAPAALLDSSLPNDTSYRDAPKSELRIVSLRFDAFGIALFGLSNYNSATVWLILQNALELWWYDVCAWQPLLYSECYACRMPWIVGQRCGCGVGNARASMRHLRNLPLPMADGAQY